MYASRGKRRHLYRRLRGCYRILETGRRKRDGFWESLNEYCLPCVEVCRTLTPSVRLSHLKVLLLLPSLLCLTLLYMKTDSDTRLQMMADVDRPHWAGGADRLLGRFFQWELLRRRGAVGVPPTPSHVLPPDCEALFSGNPLEVRITREMVYTETRSSSGGLLLTCEQLRNDSRTSSQQEQAEREVSSSPPLAYVIYVKHQAAQLLQLLRAVHTDNGSYCLYLSTHSPPALRAATEQLAACLRNVLVAPPHVSHTDLDAQQWCLRRLVSWSSPRWRHLIHLSDQYFPLATNPVISRTLARHRTASEVPAVLLGGVGQLAGSLNLPAGLRSALLTENIIHNGSQPLQVPKDLADLTLYRGDYCFVAHRSFIEFSLQDAIAGRLFAWTKRTFRLPSLVFWPTLYAARGSSSGRGWGRVLAVSKQSLVDVDYVRRCVAEDDPLCVFTVDDLSWLAARPQLFAGRFDMDVDHVVLHCLAQRRQTLLRNQLTSSSNIPEAHRYNKRN